MLPLNISTEWVLRGSNPDLLGKSQRSLPIERKTRIALLTQPHPWVCYLQPRSSSAREVKHHINDEYDESDP